MQEFNHHTRKVNKHYLYVSSFILILACVLLYYQHFGKSVKTNDPNIGYSFYSISQIDINLKDAVLIDADNTLFTIWAKSVTPEIEIKSKTGSLKNLLVVVKNVAPDNSSVDITGKAEIKTHNNNFLFKLDLNKNPLNKIKIYPKNESKNFTFVVIGDTRGGENPFTNHRGSYFIYRKFEKDINKIKPLFWVNTGDMVNSGHLQQYRRLRKQLTHIPFPFFPVIGNHEYIDPEGRKYFRLLFGKSNYSFNYSGYHFVFLDNSHGDFSKDNFSWLENDLAENTLKNIIVFTHIPVFDPRPGENYAMKNSKDAWLLEEIMVKKKVKYVFSGHIHGYYYAERKGIKYYITAGGGAKLVSNKDPYHYLVVKAEGNNLKVDVQQIKPPFIFIQDYQSK